MATIYILKSIQVKSSHLALAAQPRWRGIWFISRKMRADGRAHQIQEIYTRIIIELICPPLPLCTSWHVQYYSHTTHCDVINKSAVSLWVLSSRCMKCVVAAAIVGPVLVVLRLLLGAKRDRTTMVKAHWRRAVYIVVCGCSVWLPYSITPGSNMRHIYMWCEEGVWADTVLDSSGCNRIRFNGYSPYLRIFGHCARILADLNDIWRGLFGRAARVIKSIH